ncbi:putative Ig domain-containing protein [Kitasatospora sp. RB6PN24]|uniref:putative Ig domain-containing protein n=1 Tax=Kitasatospora humi TaxID=2893891 RepID=UPI001E282B64|nr:putative Ig domain-containing protein [Kitasatospora humi]MCC9305602.1 putative Ig domain-containing protein [Kitasatospora humi]
MSVTRRLLTIVAAGATSLAAVLVPTAAAHAAAGTYSLVVLPDQGESAIYNFVNSATKSIDVTIYELRDTTLVNDLIAKHKAGVTVRVIMDGKQTSVNGAAYSALQSAGVGVTYSSTTFVYTHQKTITVDGNKSYISTGNFDTTYYSTSRDYGVFDTDSADVAAIEAVFNADYAKTSITPSDGDNLVWSPTDSQTQLLNLVNGAQHSLDVEEEEFGDTALVNAVVADAQRGVAVRVVAENENSTYTSELNQVTAAGGKVTTYTSSTGYYIHAKAIVADYGTSTAKAFAGSENFSDNSLNHNRELGIILSDSGVVGGLESAITADFNHTAGSGSGTVTVTTPGNQSGTVGTAASLQISASDTATGTLSYSASGLPAGLSINSSTGLISGTPTTAGTSNVTVTATDSTGPTGSTTFTWTISGGGGNTVTVTNPGNQTGTVGTAASVQITAGDSAGGQTLSYSATGLPAGLSINSSTGLISGTPTTAGTSNVTVTAKDTTNASGSAGFTWTVNPSSGGGCTASQLLGNPGFETGTASPWTASSGVISDSASEPAHSGSWDAWLDGYGTATTDTLAQTVTLPTGCTNENFSYWLHIDTAETSTTTAYDTLKVQVLNSSGTVLGTLASYSNLNANSGYAQHTLNLSAYAGQTVTLKFTGTEDSEYQTSFVIDDTAVNVS